MNKLTSIAYSLLVIALAIYASQIATNTIQFQDDLQQRAVDLFTNLGVLVIVVERSLEIFTLIWRRKGKVELDQALNSEEEKLIQTRKNWEAKLDDDTEAKFEDARSSRDSVEKGLEEYRADTAIITIRTSLIIGIIISAIGFRVLQTLFISDDLMGKQLLLFNVVDILLSAGILAGGSAGIHAVSSTLGKFFENSNKRLRQTTTP